MPIELVDNGLGITQKATVEETSRGIYLLKRNSKVARVMAIGLTICVIVIWPWTILCPTNWTIYNRDCCSPTFGLNSTSVTFDVTQGVEFPMNFIVWNDSNDSSIAIDTDWGTLNIYWGQLKGTRLKPYSPSGFIDIVRIFYEEGKGLFGLQFHDSSGFSPVLGLSSPTYVDLNVEGRPFSGWGVITHQSSLLQSLGGCFRMG